SSNQAYLASGSNTVYNLPISNGLISVQNSFGTICIDYQCPTNANISSSVSLSSQLVHAANFNGQSSAVSIASSNGINFDMNTPFSFSFFMKSTQSGNGIIISKYRTTIDTGWQFQILNGQLRMAFVCSGSYLIVHENPLVDDGNWHHIAMTYDGKNTATSITIYVDGSAEPLTVENNNCVGSVSNGDNLVFGQASTLPVGQYYSGQLGNMQVYNSQLTANQVLQLYNSGIPPSAAATIPMSWYP
ncbi:MAG: LamG domain-containing protein, partial [Candidatus Micrarchaeota archaeon]|nr:LamG domain-containing protein [Candidatus Micrarchaeota archaeon]